MSWDVDLYDDRGHCEGSWNYTHNVNGMANAVIDDDELRAGDIRWWTKRGRPDIVARTEAGERVGSWWACLDGMPGPVGAEFIGRIIKGLEAEPERFRAMNPENNWGNYDQFLAVLHDMHTSVPEWPTEWKATG